VVEPSEIDCRWLVSPASSPYLDQALESTDFVRLTKSLRRQLPVERVNLVLEQVTLRQHAREKFSRAGDMFFLRKLLEQATEERIAVYKAGRFPANDVIVDLCCGLGGDMIGFGVRGPVIGVDASPAACVLAEANNRVYGSASATTVVDNAESFCLDTASFWHMDPDRRATGGRTTHAQFFEPSAEAIDRIRTRGANGAVKLASATLAPADWVANAELEWIGSRRECRQQVAWFGDLAKSPAQHRATVVGSQGDVSSVVGQPDESLPLANTIGRFIYEPHAAVLAAKLMGTLANQHRLSAISPRVAYLTSDEPVSTPLLGSFEVLELLPFDLRRLRAALHERRVGRLEIKARDVDVVPDQLRKKLALVGEEEMTLLIAGPQPHVRAVLAKRWKDGG
jgi:hypothetical protein